MSLNRIGKKAEALLKRLAMLNAPPIDVHRVAQELGLRILTANLGDGVSGILARKQGSPTVICVHEDDAAIRQRFTIAHEIGHHYLDHVLEGDWQVHVDRGIVSHKGTRSEGALRYEIEANQFAASLLMPAELIIPRAAELSQGPLLDVHLSELASEFQVAEHAMTIRLITLDLV
ncbi:MAG: ImmA/IrrE family metallo-endopeptidase [Polyangiaceae bacterium]|nr:ImmA/IrrE family metallo-endopeptidase [Polyangiaceae bacterium]